MGNKCFSGSEYHQNNCDINPASWKDDEESSAQSKLDWDSEASVNHRSAINSLHNYALGKMGSKVLDLEVNKPKSPKSPIRFSESLVQTFILENGGWSVNSSSEGQDWETSGDHFDLNHDSRQSECSEHSVFGPLNEDLGPKVPAPLQSSDQQSLKVADQNEEIDGSNRSDFPAAGKLAPRDREKHPAVLGKHLMDAIST